MCPIKVLLLYAQTPNNYTLSYQIGWPKHFQRHPSFKCFSLNVYNRGRIARLRERALLRWARFDAIIILHSVFSNSCYLSERRTKWLFNAVRTAPQPKAYFIGNEYRLMPEKMAFCEALNMALLVTMNPAPAAQALYRERLGCALTCIPSAGLDTDIFRPTTNWGERPIDLGYRCYAAPLTLGHNERSAIADHFLQHGPRYGLHLDISLDHRERFETAGWAKFLNRCKGQLGTEAGGDYFELTDATRLQAEQYLKAYPDATMEDVFERFFKDYPNPVPGRMISGRHVEAAGTKTVQILLEGDYNGYFQPDVHYIPLKKDFRNTDEVIAKFRDEGYCQHLAYNAYQVATQELTYEKLIDRFYEALVPLI